MNVKQITCVAKMFVITCVVCPLRRCVANLHDNSKSNMAAIVNKVDWYKRFQSNKEDEIFTFVYAQIW